MPWFFGSSKEEEDESEYETDDEYEEGDEESEEEDVTEESHDHDNVDDEKKLEKEELVVNEEGDKSHEERDVVVDGENNVEVANDEKVASTGDDINDAVVSTSSESKEDGKVEAVVVQKGTAAEVQEEKNDNDSSENQSNSQKGKLENDNTNATISNDQNDEKVDSSHNENDKDKDSDSSSSESSGSEEMVVTTATEKEEEEIENVDDDTNNRARSMSYDTNGTYSSDEYGGAHTTEDEIEEESDEEVVEEDEDEDEEVTSPSEKYSLLALAAEHDRVDILKAILTATDTENKDNAENKAAGCSNNNAGSIHTNNLLNSRIPPLHMAVSYGSINAINCLLRMGADPSIRPNVPEIKKEIDSGSLQVDIPHIGRFHDISAWELAFGFNDDDKKSRTPVKGIPVDMPPSKREGIRHAFTAEALRCIGADEVHRLQQLVQSGMPSTIDIAGNNLYDWSVEMSALHCEEFLRPAEAARHEGEQQDDASKGEQLQDGASRQQTETGTQQQQQQQPLQPGDSTTTTTTTNDNASAKSTFKVLDRSQPGQKESVSQLINRLDELESLSKALSTCLDNLAEEVSVCHGLLLMGGGASALASHVRSLKNVKQKKNDELERMQDAYENSLDELAYWVKECNTEEGNRIANSLTITSSHTNNHNSKRQPSRRDSFPEAQTEEEEEKQRRQLKAEIAATENKVRKLRASIADLSEENTRDLEEVEKRGLSGGIKLVRGLRDEIREVEFQLNEIKSAEALCRTKVSLIQSEMDKVNKNQNVSSQLQPVSAPENKNDINSNNNTDAANNSSTDHHQQQRQAAIDHNSATAPPKSLHNPDTSSRNNDKEIDKNSRGIENGNHASNAAAPKKNSEVITSGESTAIAIRTPATQNSGYFQLWNILLRIIGLGSGGGTSRQQPQQQQQAGATMGPSNVMIV